MATDAEKLIALAQLADDAEDKGWALQQMPELKLVGNAYVGMAQRIRAVLDGTMNGPEKAGGA